MNGRALDLRRAFDASFASPQAPPAAGAEAFLLIRAGGDRCALRIRDVAQLTVDRPVTPVPSRRPELLGLAGLRGAVVPAFSLARLLGSAEGVDPPRWMAMAGDFAVAFEGFERFLRLPPERLSRMDAPRRHVDELILDGPLAAPVVNLSSIRRSVTGRDAR